VGKFGSFGFAEGSACVSGKTKCAKCVSALKLFLKIAGGQKIKIHWVGLRVGQSSDVV